ncbi:MAG TPA: hypothetical protein PKH02_03610, partial [Bacteroidales bacterium]|nr:hypothetical protein [Bacteroidales bacterium]
MKFRKHSHKRGFSGIHILFLLLLTFLPLKPVMGQEKTTEENLYNAIFDENYEDALSLMKKSFNVNYSNEENKSLL